MRWLAAAVGCELKRVHFSKFGLKDIKIVKYLDFLNANVPQRCVAVEADALSDPLLIPILSGAGKVVFFITQDRALTESSIEKLSIAHQTLLQESPQVFVLFSSGGRDQAVALEKRLEKIGITPIYPNLHTNDFRAIWEVISKSSITTERKELDGSESASALVPEIAAVTPKAKVSALNSATRTTDDLVRKKAVKTIVEKIDEKKSTVTTTSDAIARITSSTTTSITQSGDLNMANINDSLASLMAIDGAMGCFIADYSSGMVLAKAGAGVNLDVAAAGNTEVIKAKMKTMVALGISDTIEDILITLTTQYHIIRPMAAKQGLFLYIVLDKAKSNLAMARFKLLDAEKALVV